jgi:hypothetical protein
VRAMRRCKSSMPGSETSFACPGINTVTTEFMAGMVRCVLHDTQLRWQLTTLDSETFPVCWQTNVCASVVTATNVQGREADRSAALPKNAC